MSKEIILRDYQDKVVNETRKRLSEGIKHLMVQLPTGGGKCLAKGTKILMFDGTTKKVENLKPFDLLMGVDSTHRTVKSVCNGFEDMYKINPVKGDSFTVNESHILSFKISGKSDDYTICGNQRFKGGDIANVKLINYLNSSKTFKHRAKIWRTDVDFMQTYDLPIDPYFLGLWLADGNSKKISFTFHNNDVEIIDFLYDFHQNIRKEYNSKNSHNYHFRKHSHLDKIFNELDLFSNKHIPHAYKISSRTERFEILAGILDGDGHLHHSGFDWISVSEKLCDDVMFLCRSLGFSCYKSAEEKRCANTDKWNIYYRLNICGNTDKIPTKLLRKKAKPRKQKKDVLVTGVKSVECLGNGQYFGFELYENDKLFMLSDFTVTHNTIIFSYISQNAIPKGKKVLILTDRTELLTQAGGTLGHFNINPYMIKAGAKIIDHRKSCFIAMSQTLRNRINKPEWQGWITKEIDIVIIDEAHIQEFNYIFESGLLDDKIVIGFTATPSRSGKMRQLGLDYERMVRGPQVKELVNKGYLVNCDIYDCGSPSMENVSINSKTNDYNYNSMANAFDKPNLYAGLLKNYEKYTPGQKMIVFCCNVKHAIKTCISFAEKGYQVKFVTSKKSKPKKPPQEATEGKKQKYLESLKAFEYYEENYSKFSGSRKTVINWFSKTDGAILVNVDMLTKGFDEPSIEVVALYRATKSITLYLQMIGRGSRINEGKPNFTLFDFGGNVQRLGSYEQNREWSLWHEEKKGGGGVPPLKDCGLTNKGKPIIGSGNVKNGCKRLIPISLDLCPFCGFKYPEKDPAKEIELELAKITDENGVSIKVKSFRQMSHYELKKYREIKEHHMAWLWRQLWMRGGESELRKFASYDSWNPSTTNRAVMFCKQKFRS